MDFLILILFVIIHSCYSSIRTIECDSGLANLATDEFVMFQSPKYPDSFVYTKNYSQSCQNIFVMGFTTKVFYISTLKLINAMPRWYSYFTETPKINMTFHEVKIYSNYSLGLSNWKGFQAFVYAPDSSKTKACPLNGKLFELTDNTEIIPITSSFYFHDTKFNSEPAIQCLWTFKIPDGFKLKINIKQMNFSATESLNLKVNNGSIIFLKTAGVQYFNGSFFSLVYNKTATGNNNYGFGGLISVVETNANITNLCIDENNTFSYIDQENGYKNNEHCTQKLTIAKNQTMYLSVSSFLESGVDNLTAIDSLGNKVDLTQSENWLIDEKAGNVLLEFKSDGSSVQSWFSTNISDRSCKCEKAKAFHVDCDGWLYDYKRFDLMFKSYTYCGGMKCSFKLSYDKIICTKTNYFIFIMPSYQLRPNKNDRFHLIQNNKIVIDINSSSKPRNHYILKSYENIIINFESDSTLAGIYPAPSAFFISLSTDDLYIQTIQLSQKRFTYSIDLYNSGRKDLITIIAPTGYTLDMYTFDGDYVYRRSSNYYFYDSKKTENFIGTFKDLPMHPTLNAVRHYSSTSQAITMLGFANEMGVVFFRLREIHTKNCPTLDNFATVFDGQVIFNSLEMGPCFLTIFNWNEYHLRQTEYSNFVTDSQKENVKFVPNLNSKFTIFEFNANSVSQWTNLNFGGITNSFIIPANSTLSFSIDSNTTEDEYVTYKNVTHGILSSYSLSDYNSGNYGRILLPHNSSCKMIVKNLNISPISTLYAKDDNWNSEKINQINQTFSLSIKGDSSSIEIPYVEFDPTFGEQGYVVEFEIINLNDGFKTHFSFWLFILYLMLNFFLHHF